MWWVTQMMMTSPWRHLLNMTYKYMSIRPNSRLLKIGTDTYKRAIYALKIWTSKVGTGSKSSVRSSFEKSSNPLEGAHLKKKILVRVYWMGKHELWREGGVEKRGRVFRSEKASQGWLWLAGLCVTDTFDWSTSDDFCPRLKIWCHKKCQKYTKSRITIVWIFSKTIAPPQ